MVPLTRIVSLPAAENTGGLQKLENPVQNTSFESIVGARPTAAPRNGREK